MQTKVIFRKWKHTGDVIALFPEHPGTNDPNTCQSYEHVGQHGAADPDIVQGCTTRATPDEYRDLLNELTLIGYKSIRVVSRFTRAAYRKRYDEIHAIT